MMFLEFFQHRSQYSDIDLEAFYIVHSPKWDFFFITYNYLCRLNFLEKEIAELHLYILSWDQEAWVRIILKRTN